MAVFKIYYGTQRPIRAVGVHCVRLLRFAEAHRGWHTFKQDRTTRRAIESLMRIGCIEVDGDQFRFKYPPVMKPFTFDKWHAWEGVAGILLSDESIKKLYSFKTIDDTVNWLFLNDQKSAGRALNEHAKTKA